jgi:ribosomal protein L37E
MRLDSSFPYDGLTADLRHADGSVAILDYLRRMPDLYHGVPPPIIQLHYPAHFLGSSYHMRAVNAPLTPALLSVARSWVNSPEAAIRLNAVDVLATSQNASHVALLKSLLADPATFASDGAFKLHSRTYVVREAAFDVLQRWHVFTQRPVIHEPADIRRHFSSIGVVSGVLLFLILILFWAGASSRPDQSFGTRTRKLALRTLLFAGILLAGAWMRSRWVVYQLEIPIGQLRLELSSTPEGLQATWIEGWPMHESPSLVSLPTDTDLDQLWKYQIALRDSIADGESESRWYTSAAGSAVGWNSSANPGPVSWHSLRIPYLWLILLTTLFPVAAFARVILRPFIINVQVCSRCGYDLRATKDRCPECGTPKQKTRQQLRRERMAREDLAREAAEKRRALLALKVQACSDGLETDEWSEDADAYPADTTEELPM